MHAFIGIQIDGISFSDVVKLPLCNPEIMCLPFLCRSPGFGISLVAETTTGCFISTDATISHSQKEDLDDLDKEKKEITPPDEVGEQAASMLLGEIEQGGVVDSTHQVCACKLSFLFLLYFFTD